MTDAPTFDLQSHSLFSDGALAPREVVAGAAEAGVELLALTDHDSVDGVEEALAAGSEHGIRVVSGTELSSLDGDRDLHIVGYAFDQRNEGLASRLESYRADRERRAAAMSEALQELGFELDDTVLAARTAQGKSIGRPHLAQAVVKHPANAERLRAEGRDETSAFLVAYLIEGRPGFRSRTIPTIAQAIEAIHDAGGVAVWAHPFFDVSDPSTVLASIDRFRSVGLDGVECFYPTHERDQVELLVEHCTAHGMLITGSSDFHGPRHREFSRFRAFSTYGREPVLDGIA